MKGRCSPPKPSRAAPQAPRVTASDLMKGRCSPPSRAAPQAPPIPERGPPLPPRSSPVKSASRQNGEALAKKLLMEMRSFKNIADNTPRRFVRVTHRTAPVASGRSSVHELFIRPGEIVELIDTADEVDGEGQPLYPGWWRGRIAVNRSEFPGSPPQRSAWFKHGWRAVVAFDSARPVATFGGFAAAMDELLWDFAPALCRHVEDEDWTFFLEATWRQHGGRLAAPRFLAKLHAFLRGQFAPGRAESHARSRGGAGRLLRTPRATALFPSNCVELLELPAKVEAQYPLAAGAEGCLSLKKGDTITLTSGPEIDAVRPRGAKSQEDEWWTGVNARTGAEGMFPKAYVTALVRAAASPSSGGGGASALLVELRAAHKLAERAQYLGLERHHLLSGGGGAAAAAAATATSTTTPALQQKIDMAFHAADIDRNGELDRAEFADLVASVVPGAGAARGAEAFYVYDVNRDGLIQRGEAAEALKGLWYQFGDSADEASSTLPGSSLAQFCRAKASAAGGVGRALFCEAIDRGQAALASPTRMRRHASIAGRNELVVDARKMREDARITDDELHAIEAKVAQAIATSPYGGASGMAVRAVSAVDQARISHRITSDEAETIERTIRRAVEDSSSMTTN